MSLDRVALIADIHGNRWALDAVLADIGRRGVGAIFDLGDSLYGPLDPKGTAERLLESGIPSLRGNCDRMLLDPVPATATYAYTVAAVRPEHIAWLRALPPTRRVDGDVLLCHGTPGSDATYLLERPTKHGGLLRPAAEIAAELEGLAAPVVACGHSHVPRAAWLEAGRLVVNPGSVGLPAYDDDVPSRHVMEAGSPHARYAVLTRQGAGRAVEHVAVPYDWAAASSAAREHGREDWAQALLTGRARRG